MGSICNLYNRGWVRDYLHFPSCLLPILGYGHKLEYRLNDEGDYARRGSTFSEGLLTASLMAFGKGGRMD